MAAQDAGAHLRSPRPRVATPQAGTAIAAVTGVLERGWQLVARQAGSTSAVLLACQGLMAVLVVAAVSSIPRALAAGAFVVGVGLLAMRQASSGDGASS